MAVEALERMYQITGVDALDADYQGLNLPQNGEATPLLPKHKSPITPQVVDDTRTAVNVDTRTAVDVDTRTAFDVDTRTAVDVDSLSSSAVFYPIDL